MYPVFFLKKIGVVKQKFTNFIFFHSQRDIRELGPKMLEKGLRIGRPFPPFYDWCRISTGTIEEVDLFIKGMLEVYES